MLKILCSVSAYHIRRMQTMVAYQYEQAMGPALYARKSDAETAKIGGRIESLRGVDTPNCGVAGTEIDHAILLRDILVNIMDVTIGRVTGGPEVEVVEEGRASKGALE